MAGIDIEWEKDVIAACLRDVSFVRAALPVLRRHHFADETLSWIWGVTQETYTSSHEIPTGRVFKTRIERDYSDEESKDYVAEVLVNLRRRKAAAPRSALEEVRRFVRLSALRRATDGVVTGIDDGDLEAAERALSEGLEETRTASLLEEPHSWAELASERLRDYTEGLTGRLVFSTPLPTLNRVTGGGPRAGDLNVVTALTGTGKSSWAVDVGFTALMVEEAAVGHISTEETRLELSGRYDARATKITRDLLLSGRLTKAQRQAFEEWFRDRAPKVGSRLQLMEIPPQSSVAGVRVLAEQLREHHPDLPILLVVDSPDHLLPAVRSENFRLGASSVYWYLKALALDPTLAPLSVWATCQAPQRFVGKRLNLSAFAESFDKVRIADVAIGLMEGDDPDPHAPTRTIEVVLLKNRLGRVKSYLIYTDADLGTNEFTEVAATEYEEEESESPI